MEHKEISILGAGLVGSLLAALLSQKGFGIDVFEMRGDPRSQKIGEGRSINLALSHRGITALKQAGVFEKIEPTLIPMMGRMIHDLQGNLNFQSYGRASQHINSVSRSGLNKLLIDHAESHGVNFHFGHKCGQVDLDGMVMDFEGASDLSVLSKVLIGADGAFSMLRRAMEKTDRFNFHQHYIEHGYKELHIPAINGTFAMEPNNLHIWPRGNFMLIALPNPDCSFTCTLFFPFEGDLSFESLKDDGAVWQFFETYFQDVLPLIPDLVTQFQTNPTASLVTIKTSPWAKGRSLLIGDASHAIVPFYGQGMNAGFEDCRLFMEWGEKLDFDWDKLLPYFSKHRKADADAIADLAMKNFVEMRDKVADDRFVAIKKLESRLQEAYPDSWIPLYSMVTFSDIPYSKAKKLGELQEQIMRALPADFDPMGHPLAPIIEEFNALKKDVL
ncbi:FAD-dependent oxidoreductase [Marinoscillum sp.]|uniref:FAD-dependent oxidoreductase n=1 Tax=Marinoscillum sp. TaxID=2024838 RepID=UPI003BACFCDB